MCVAKSTVTVSGFTGAPVLLTGLKVIVSFWAAVPAFAAGDVTIFGAGVHQGKLTLQSAQTTASPAPKPVKKAAAKAPAKKAKKKK